MERPADDRRVAELARPHLRVHRDELHLRKSGTISLGQAVSINVDNVIYFEAE